MNNMRSDAPMTSEASDKHQLTDGFVEGFAARYPRHILETLLRDRTTGRNIIWADGEYESLGDGYAPEEEITVDAIAGDQTGIVKPRILKAQESQSRLTKEHAEVFTPSWLVNQMNNALDAVWFRHPGTFNMEEGHDWEPNPERVTFPKVRGRGWHDYVRSARLEITCGEAPFLCSRYDTVTGQAIPVSRRIGILDRKLRVVGERTRTYEEWARWALVALRGTYGYEYQGDNLLIARINTLETFSEHCLERWGVIPGQSDLEQATWIVSWNLWQMNGLSCTVPTDRLDAPVRSQLDGYVMPEPETAQTSLFSLLGEAHVATEDDERGRDYSVPLCLIYDWRANEPVEFSSLKGEASGKMKKFYAIIGNPPYQTEPEQGSTRALPIYDKFMDGSHEVAERVELVTPARFLFGSGQTKADWNERMLADRRLKVLMYEPDSSKVFNGVDIKGGIAVTYWGSEDDHEPIGTFIPIPELSDIASKAAAKSVEESLTSIAGTSSNYNFSKMYEEHPEYSQFISGNGKHSQLKSNALERVPIFTEERQGDDDLQIYGLVDRNRVLRWCPRRYIDLSNECLFKWKVILPESNGSGTTADILSSPVVFGPGVGFTQTFMCIGRFDTKAEAEAMLKYLKTRFVRTLLSILKNTQHNPAIVWRKVPLQDFSDHSDIDWSRSVKDIDNQLVEKYGLTEGDVAFMSAYAKEMS